MDLRNFVKISRANFLPASLIAFLLGAAYSGPAFSAAWQARFWLGLAGVGAAHLAGNLFNELFDSIRGADTRGGVSPFFGGSGSVAEGIVSHSGIFRMAAVMSAVSALCGLALVLITGDLGIIFFILAGGLLLFEYTGPPFKFCYNGLGEIVIFLTFGVLLVNGAFYVFSGNITPGSIMVSMPISFFITAVIVANEIPDDDTDRKVNKKNLVSFAGKENAYIIYTALILAAFFFIILNAVKGTMAPFVTLLIPAVYFFARKAILILRAENAGMEKYIEASGITIGIHAISGMVMILAVILR